MGIYAVSQNEKIKKITFSILLVSHCILHHPIGMTENQTVLEWERKARDTHGSYTIAIPKQVAKRWKIGSGSILTVALLSDGSLNIKLSEDELRYQAKTEEMMA